MVLTSIRLERSGNIELPGETRFKTENGIKVKQSGGEEI